MRFDKLTIKSQEALGEAQTLAGSRGHSEIQPAHLLRALLGQPEGSSVPVLQKLGIRIDSSGRTSSNCSSSPEGQRRRAHSWGAPPRILEAALAKPRR
jgi:ATP-dependent Clp protease ATP-binding subunit ClpA